MGYNVLGLFLGVMINGLLFSIILAFTFYSKFKFRFKTGIWKGMIKYTIPLLPFTFLNVVFESVDKLFLNADSGSSNSGIYYLALTFAAIFSSFKESVVTALTPWVFENMKQNIQKVTRVFNVVVIITGLVGFVVSLFSKEILVILSSNVDFVEAHHYIPLTVISFYIIFLGQLFNMKTFYFGTYHKYLFIATGAGIFAEIIGCYFLIPIYDIYGAVVSRIIAFSTQAALLVYYSRKERQLKEMYNYKFLFLSVFVLSFLIALPSFIEFNFLLYQNILLKLGIVAFLFVFLGICFKKDLLSAFETYKHRIPFINKFL